MAEYNYKGYTADVYEDRVLVNPAYQRDTPPRMVVHLYSEFGNHRSKVCSAEEARLIRIKFIRWFESSVLKHLGGR